MRAMLLGLGVCASACSQSGADPAAPPPSSNGAQISQTVVGEREAVAYYAGGCFWGVEHYLEALPGVINVDSGYMGGRLEAPTYEDISYKDTGHLEAVQVRYNPDQVSYEAVTKLFFEIHDPTQANGQGPDIGAQYLSAVFYADEAEKKIVEGLIGKLVQRGYDVVTELQPAAKFWRAEDYHQDYYAKSGKKPYCHSRIKRFGD